MQRYTHCPYCNSNLNYVGEHSNSFYSYNEERCDTCHLKFRLFYIEDELLFYNFYLKDMLVRVIHNAGFNSNEIFIRTYKYTTSFPRFDINWSIINNDNDLYKLYNKIKIYLTFS